MNFYKLNGSLIIVFYILKFRIIKEIKKDNFKKNKRKILNAKI